VTEIKSRQKICRLLEMHEKRLVAQISEKCIATLAGFGNIFGAQRTTDALLGDWRRVNGVMNEPGAVIIPEVMVRVIETFFIDGQFSVHNILLKLLS